MSLGDSNSEKKSDFGSGVDLNSVIDQSGVKSERSPESRGSTDDQPEPLVFSSSGRRPPVNPHETGWTSWGRVFANVTAGTRKADAAYPEGSVFVREKLLTESDSAPAVITVMVKRRKGFSSGSGDWEYFVLNGSDLKVLDRQKKGSCAKCHAGAETRDWVFGNYFSKQ